MTTTETTTLAFPWRAVTLSLVATTMYAFSIFGFLPFVAQYINQMVCEHEGYAGHCDDPAVTGISANKLRIFEIIQYGAATLMLGTLGSLSDYYGRKALFYIATSGQLVQITLALFSFHTSYDNIIILIYVSSLVNGLCGSYGGFLMSTYAYGADLTRGPLAPYRARLYAFITGAVAVGNMLGPLISGWLLQLYGFEVVTWLHVVLSCLALVIIFIMQESWDISQRPSQPFQPIRKHNTLVILYMFLSDNVSTSKEKQEASATGSGVKHETPPSSPPTSGRGGRRRHLPLGLLAIVFFFFFGDLVGQGVIFVFYSKTAFKMTPKEIGYYDSFLGATKALTSFVVLPVMYSCLSGPPNDLLFCFMGMACNLVFYLLMALVPYEPVVWAIVPLNGLSQMTFPHLRSLFSQSVSPDMQGRLFAVMSAIETLSTTITPIIVAPVFKHTADKYVGAVWFVMVGFVTISAISLYVAYLISLTPSPSSDCWSSSCKEWKESSDMLTRDLLSDYDGETPPVHEEDHSSVDGVESSREQSVPLLEDP